MSATSYRKTAPGEGRALIFPRMAPRAPARVPAAAAQALLEEDVR